mgnify:CR=1 FL=1
MTSPTRCSPSPGGGSRTCRRVRRPVRGCSWLPSESSTGDGEAPVVSETWLAGLRRWGGTGQPDPETVVVQRAELDRVLKAAASLSRSDREVLSLAAWEGLSHREISEILGCSIAAVDQRLHRAKQRLTKQYRAKDGDASLRRVAGGDGS